MRCVSPLRAFRTDAGEISFKSVTARSENRELRIPCGQCINCRLERSRCWACRVLHECQMHEFNSFVTLTYDDAHLPDDASLHYSHFQLFMRRLRRKFPKCRFYMAGEYGEKYSRPHFHACLFGVHFEDRVFLRNLSSGFPIYDSALLKQLWPYGYVSIGDVTFESAAYVARYCVKVLTNPGAEFVVDSDTGELFERRREFTKMSLKPGIGANWFSKYKSEVYPLDRVVVQGREMKPPKYYDKLMEVLPGTMLDDVKYARYLSALTLHEDNSHDRLRVLEACSLARVKSHIRSF